MDTKDKESKEILDKKHISTMKETFKSVFDKNPITFVLFRLLKDEAGCYNGYKVLYKNNASRRYINCKEELVEEREFFDEMPNFRDFLFQTNLVQIEQHEIFYDSKLNKYFEAIAYQEGEGYVVCMLYDITEHENGILRRKEEMKNIINAIPRGVALYKVRANEVETVYFSDGVPALSGYSINEYEKVTKQDVFELCYQGDREKIENAIARCINKKEEVNIVFRKIMYLVNWYGLRHILSRLECRMDILCCM